MSNPEEFHVCDECGATIYPEHLEKHTAESRADRLLCPHCVRSAQPAGDDETVQLLDDDPKPRVVGGKSTRITTIGGAFDSASEQQQKFKRNVLQGTDHATRIKTFHCKLSDNSFRALDRQVNEWIDEHPEVEVKFALSTIGVVEGKHADPHLIINLFY